MKRLAQGDCQQLLDILPIGIFWKDVNSTYLGCNQYHATHAGYGSSNELMGKTDFDLPWAQMADKYQQDDQTVMATNTSEPLTFEERIVFPNKEVWAHTIKMALFDEDTGEVCGVLGIWQDLTEAKKMFDNVANSIHTLAARITTMSDKINNS